MKKKPFRYRNLKLFIIVNNKEICILTVPIIVNLIGKLCEFQFIF